MRTDSVYTPSDVFLTFPRVDSTEPLASLGGTLDSHRQAVMIRRGIGLTDLYNLVNDSQIKDKDASNIREIHVALDEALLSAYGWEDISPDHGFHTYRQVERFTVSPAARVDILDRLLEENHRRAGILVNEAVAEQGDLFS